MKEPGIHDPDLLDASLHDLSSGDDVALKARLDELQAGEIADLIESVPEPEREKVWELVPEEAAGEVLADLGEKARASLAEDLPKEQVIAAAEAMDLPDLTQVIDELPAELSESIMVALPLEVRERVEEVLAYPEGTVGRIMHPEVAVIRPDVSLDVVLRYLRQRKAIPQQTDGLMVIDRDNNYLGKLSYTALLTSDPAMTVSEVMLPEADSVRADTPETDLAILFERRDLVSVAVLDDGDKLVGVVTADDVLDIVREQADQQILNMAGLEEEEDLFAPVLPSAKRRAVWLGINLITAFLAAWVIGLFEATIDKIVALAVLMPIVASMGGIAGSQTLTLAIRGLALGQISSANTRWLAFKEIGVGMLNGVFWAVVVGAIAFVWFGSVGIGLVISAAMVLNLLAAALSGVAIPLILDRLGIDPALSGAVVLTTVTDVVGFMSFLGLATLFLL
ncbi:MAG: magnesium transporter [Gammaproteobacteria bacterium]|nr:magnesium transporter [Gammaproteobacteria bacterium]